MEEDPSDIDVSVNPLTPLTVIKAKPLSYRKDSRSTLHQHTLKAKESTHRF